MIKNLCLALMTAAIAALAIVVVRQNQQIAQLENIPPAPIITQIVKVAVAPPPLPAPAKVKPLPGPVAESAAEPSIAPAITNMMAGLAGMMKYPQFKEMLRAQQSMMFDQTYGSLAKSVKLSDDQAATLKNLLVDRQMAMTDAGMALMSGNGDAKQAAADSAAVKADYDAKIKDLLGPVNYQLFQQYEQTQPERTQVDLFKNQLSGSDVLTDQQHDDLIAALYQQRQNLPASSMLNNQNPDPAKFTQEGIAEALKQQEQLQKLYSDAAATVLTAPQLEQFTKFQDQMKAMQAMGMKMAAQMFANKPATTAPGPAK